MIRVKFEKKENKLIGFSITGHANYDVYGNDIVCSAVSMLAINTVNAIKKFTTDENDTIYDDRGELSIRILSEVSKETELLLNTFELGINEVQREYGNEFIYIKTEEV